MAKFRVSSKNPSTQKKMQSLRHSLRQSLSRSYHATSTSYLHRTSIHFKEVVSDDATLPSTLSVVDEEIKVTTPTTPTDMPSNLSLDDPHVLEEASPLDMHGAKRGQPETTPASMSSPTLELPIQNFHDNQISGNTQLNHKIFAHPIRRDLVHRVVKWQLAKRRQGTHKQKNISEVSGSGRKPWKQKGTGKARAGHRRPPHWRGGARAFPKVPRDYSFKLQKKVRNQGLKSALSAKVLEGAIHVVDVTSMNTHKTAALVSWLAEREIDSALIVDGDETNDNLNLAASNIPRVRMMPQRAANVYDIVQKRDLILTTEGLKELTHRILTTGGSKGKKKAANVGDQIVIDTALFAEAVVELAKGKFDNFTRY